MGRHILGALPVLLVISIGLAMWPVLLVISIGLAMWTLYQPAILSTDSLEQYRQAVTGQITDWHPPIMSIVVAELLRAGGELRWLMLGQSVLASLSVWAFAAACLRFFYGDELSPLARRWLALLAVLVLLLPFFPLRFYFMIFWKDSWAAWSLLGLLALLLNAFASPRDNLPRAFWARMSAIVALTILFLLVRYNAVVLLPSFMLCIYILCRRRHCAAVPALATAAAVPVLFFTANALLYLAFSVERVHAEKPALALDLVGICVLDDRCRASLPFTDANLIDDRYRTQYRFADSLPFFLDPIRITRPEYIAGPSDQLRSDYAIALREYPWLLLRVKAIAFGQVLGLGEIDGWIHDRIDPNPYGLHLDDRYGGIRGEFAAAANRVIAHPLLRWLSGVHLVWFVVNLLWLVGLAVHYRRTRERSALWLALLLTLPLGYYLSYFLAVAGPDFRYMYPATLVIQVLTVSAAVGMMARSLGRSRQPEKPGR
jgi:hypothetical protein